MTGSRPGSPDRVSARAQGRRAKGPAAAKGARVFAGLVAASAWFAFLLPFALIAGRRGSAAAALWFMARFFSYLLDGAVALAFTRFALRPRPAPSLFGGLALNAALVAVVYRALLAGLLARSGPGQLGNLFLHSVTPALVVLFWALCVPRGQLRIGDLARWAAAPLLYLACALALGHRDGFYPYPFLNVPLFGWAAVARNAAIIAAGYLAAGAALVWADRRLGRRRA